MTRLRFWLKAFLMGNALVITSVDQFRVPVLAFFMWLGTFVAFDTADPNTAASAQNTFTNPPGYANVVATCGSAGYSATGNPTLAVTQDVNGNLCMAAGAAPAPTSANGGYPPGATPIVGVGTGTTGAVTATLASGGGTKVTYFCGFDVSAIGGTATIGPITTTGLASTFTYQLASTATGNNFSRTFTPCIPASAAATAITLSTTADGTASAVDVNLYGFQL